MRIDPSLRLVRVVRLIALLAIFLGCSLQSWASVHTATDIPLAIPDDQSIVYSTLPVAGEPTGNTKVALTVQLRHTFRGDLNLVLESPTGEQKVLFVPDPTDFADDILIHDLTLNFGNINPNGNWYLVTRDNFSKDVGQIVSWSLDFGGEATTKALLKYREIPGAKPRIVSFDEAGRTFTQLRLTKKRGVIAGISEIAVYSGKKDGLVIVTFAADGTVRSIRSADATITFAKLKTGGVSVTTKLKGRSSPAPGRLLLPTEHADASAALLASVTDYGQALAAAGSPTGNAPTGKRIPIPPALLTALIGNAAEVGSNAASAAASATLFAQNQATSIFEAGLQGLQTVLVDIRESDLYLSAFDNLGPLVDLRLTLERTTFDLGFKAVAAVENFLDVTEELYDDTGKPAPKDVYTIGETLNYSGGPAEHRSFWANPYAASSLTPTIELNWDFYSIPDRMNVYSDAGSLFATGNISGTGSQSIQLSAGTQSVEVVMNQGGNPNSSTAWVYDFTANVTGLTRQLTMQTFIPFNNIGHPANLFSPESRQTVFEGDDRCYQLGGSSRTFQTVTVAPYRYLGDADGIVDGSYQVDVGISSEYHKGTSLDGSNRLTQAARNDQTLGDFLLKHKQSTQAQRIAEAKTLKLRRAWVNDLLLVTFACAATNPLVSYAPSIDLRMSVTLDYRTPNLATATVEGEHDGFPGYEMYLGNTRIYGFKPDDESEVEQLFPGMDVKVNKGPVFVP